MYSEALEQLIQSVIADGVITEKERAVLHKKAVAEGVDEDEIEVYVDGLVAKMKPVEQKSTTPQKQGVVTKCPQCGAVVEAGAVKCAECGYVFRGVEANSSMKLLAQKLERAKKDKHESIIRDFPIPTTKEDLLEFIPSMKARFKSASSDAKDIGVKYSYQAKYTESVAKAKIYFLNDPDFQPIFSEKLYDGVFDYLKNNPRTAILVGFVVFYAVLFLICLIFC